MAKFLGFPVAQYFDDVGEVLAGGKLYVFDAGTATPRSAYPTIADAEADTNALDHPIILDSRGEVTAVLTGDNKLRLDDSSDNVVWTVDNFNIPVLINTGALVDSSDNEYIKFIPTGAAVNEFTVTNAATGNSPVLSLSGDDSNVGGIFRTKNRGQLFFEDGNSNEILIIGPAVSGATNYVDITNAAAGNSPVIGAEGGDDSISLGLQPKGTGAVLVPGTSTASAAMRLYEDTDNGTNYTGFKAPAIVTADVDMVLPDGAGVSGQVLGTDGADSFTWEDTASSSATQEDLEDGSSISSYTSPGRQQHHPSSTKAWVNTTNAGSINASYGVDSVSDSGAGNVTVNLTTDFSSVDYAIMATGGASSQEARATVYSQTVSAFSIRITDEDAQSLNGEVHASTFGDQ